MLTPSQTDAMISEIRRSAANEPLVQLTIVEGRQAAETFLTERYLAGFQLQQWSIEKNDVEGFASGAKDRFTCLLVHAKVVKMQQEAIK